jgi:hypothetical protein
MITRAWPRVGKQQLPDALLVDGPDTVAAIIGMTDAWCQARATMDRLAASWSALTASDGWPSLTRQLVTYAPEDVTRLIDLIAWIDATPQSDLYVRQVPVRGIDTKWIETRTDVITRVVRAVCGPRAGTGFLGTCGFRGTPARIRVRVLCPTLRAQLGGLGDIEAPIVDLAALTIQPTTILLVENLITGLALPDRDGVVAIIGLGNGVSLVGKLPWIRSAPRALYWGDVDTHGVAILALARTAIPHLTSILMDESTLVRYRDAWGEEPRQMRHEVPETLTAQEAAVLAGLQRDQWGRRVRLEQERIPWTEALTALDAALKDTLPEKPL